MLGRAHEEESREQLKQSGRGEGRVGGFDEIRRYWLDLSSVGPVVDRESATSNHPIKSLQKTLHAAQKCKQ